MKESNQSEIELKTAIINGKVHLIILIDNDRFSIDLGIFDALYRNILYETAKQLQIITAVKTDDDKLEVN